nr:hypothetical protein [Desulfobacterales bacterium]
MSNDCTTRQAQHMPWLGYFDKIDSADIFVLPNTVQVKKEEWQKRNRIKTPRGAVVDSPCQISIP